MEIQYKNGEITFDSLDIGDVFTAGNNEVYMKTSLTHDNAVTLKNGCMRHFASEFKVNIVNATLIVD